MKSSDLDYKLPESLIAQYPAEKRDASRLMVIDRSSGRIQLDVFENMPDYLNPDDCLALNDTRVIRARLHGRKETGGAVEIFLLQELSDGGWSALVRPSAKVRAGAKILFPAGLEAVVAETLPGGKRRVFFNGEQVISRLEEAGEIPLPPYIHRKESDHNDTTRYQTVYSKHPGAVAAPTAGLHFTENVFRKLAAAGIEKAYLTLHVGYGTFKPIQADRLSDHQVDQEEYIFPEETAQKLNDTRQRGHKVVAVGTTCTRVLESCYSDGKYSGGNGSTDLYIFPPYTFRAVDVLQTNFHLPRSSLLALVCAFAGRELLMDAYHLAIKEQFRFYSYGDVMLIR